MPRELKNAEITHVSYVEKPANKRKFLLLKEDQAEITVEEIAEQVKQAAQPIMARIENLEKSQQEGSSSIWDNLFVAEGYRLK